MSTGYVSKDARSPGACGQVPQTKQVAQSDVHLYLGLPKDDNLLRDLKTSATLVVVVCSCGVPDAQARGEGEQQSTALGAGGKENLAC